jgi:hypothetical protein
MSIIADRQPERLWRIEPNQADDQADGNADADAQEPEQQRIQEAAQQRRQAGQHDIGVEEGVQQRHGSIPEPFCVPVTLEQDPEHRNRICFTDLRFPGSDHVVPAFRAGTTLFSQSPLRPSASAFP